MAQKLTRYLLITLILSLGFGQILRFEFWGIPFYLHDLLVLALLFQTRSYFTGCHPVKYPGIKIFLFGLALGWLNALLHYPLTQLFIPSLYTLRLLAYLALYLTIRHKPYAINPKYFLISGTITLAIGYLQYFLLPDMRVFQYLGWDDHLNRLTLPHFDPTFTAVMFVLFMLSQTNIRFSYLNTVYLIPALLLTYSRSIWLSLALTAYFSLKNKFFFLLTTICVLITIFVALPQKFGEGTNLLRTYSITSRITSDLAVVKKSGWNLVVGQGLNTFPRNSINNSYLYLLATSGVLGLIGWGLFMYSLYNKSAHKPMMIFFFIASLFNNVMFYPFALLWVLLINTTTVPTEA